MTHHSTPIPTTKHYVIAILVPISWSFSFVAGKFVMTETPDGQMTVTLFRFVAALAILTPMMFFLPRLRNVPPRD
ncbi:MAG: hypothetical protein GXP29_10425, partial [Planctomycetes bacterium]|nr:hypothetical protein [Planctomycetota bacterium]